MFWGRDNGYAFALGTQKAAAQLLLQPQYTDNPYNIILHVNESLQMHFKVAVRTFHAPNASRWFPHRCSEEETIVTLCYGSLIALGTQDTAAQLLLQPQYTDNPQNKVAVRTFHAPNAGKWFPHRCSEEEMVVMLYV